MSIENKLILKISQRGTVLSSAQKMAELSAKMKASGKKIIEMHVGQPSSGAPKEAIKYAQRIMEQKTLGYTSALGISELRERISQHYLEEYKVNIPKDRIIVTVGASLALTVTLIALFDKKVKIGMPYPAYPAYHNTIQMLDLETVGIPTKLENDFQVTLEDIIQYKDSIDCLLIANPSNPTGAMIKPSEIDKIIHFCKQNNIKVISDEIYHGIVFDGLPGAKTALSMSEDVFIINSFSKLYSMPGWRVGWMVVPEDITEKIGAIIRNLYLCTPAISQYTALKAMDCMDELSINIVKYQNNRDILADALNDAGFDSFVKPTGAFYMYAHRPNIANNPHKFCLDMLSETGVATLAGIDFDPINGKEYIRFSLAGDTNDIHQACENMVKWNKKL